jgi:hypothetical protein
VESGDGKSGYMVGFPAHIDRGLEEQGKGDGLVCERIHFRGKVARWRGAATDTNRPAAPAPAPWPQLRS